MNSNLTDPAPVFVACIGLDWGDKSHALALHDPATPQTESATLTHSAENLHHWLDQLEARFGGRPVALAIEGTRGAIFPVLLERSWLHVFAVHPATSARYRSAFTPSGAKDDLPDAQVLLELLQRHRDKLTPLSLADAATRLLAGLCETRRDLVDRRTQLLNQLIACLKKFYPQALELAGENLASPLALNFLTKWPDLLTLKSARPATIKSFCYTHNVRRPETVQARLDRIAQARALTTDEAVAGVAILRCWLRDTAKGFGLWLRPVSVDALTGHGFYLLASPFPILRSFSAKSFTETNINLLPTIRFSRTPLA